MNGRVRVRVRMCMSEGGRMTVTNARTKGRAGQTRSFDLVLHVCAMSFSLGSVVT